MEESYAPITRNRSKLSNDKVDKNYEHDGGVESNQCNSIVGISQRDSAAGSNQRSSKCKSPLRSSDCGTYHCEGLFLKVILFVVVTVHSLLIYSMIRIKKIKKINYNIRDENIIFLTEIVKFFTSLIFYIHENKFNLKLIRENVSDIFSTRRFYVISLVVPSILYYLQNMLFYVAMYNIPTPLFQLLYQFRILIVVLFTFLILNKKIKSTQVVSITFLFLSLICLKDYNMDYNNHTSHKNDKINWSNDIPHDQCLFTNYIWNKKDILFYFHQGKSLCSIGTGGNISSSSSSHKMGYPLFLYEMKMKLLFQQKLNKKYGSYIFPDHARNNCEMELSNGCISDSSDAFIIRISASGANNSDSVRRGTPNSVVSIGSTNAYITSYASNASNTCDGIAKPINREEMYDPPSNNIKNEEKHGHNNILIGVLTTFLATFTSGFSSVFLEFLYVNYRYSFWFQNICLAFFSIILSVCMNNMNMSSIFNKFLNKNYTRNNNYDMITLHRSLKNRHCDDFHDSDNCYSCCNWDDYFLLSNIRNYFAQYFNSFKEFVYVFSFIFLNSFGGIMTSIFIKHVGSVTRFFVTPVSLLFNIYMSSIYFKDFEFTFNYLISLVFVSFSLYFYFKEMY
ncbi:UDP-N-acetyl glucosamine:UMP antiporter [Plasmodium brasilianum]|uniref:UDP-N-acetyl glucosamine:UMP antiporter, putative n=2 Tax=Plasmodium (Plasmodium) TaxID=418103 RepID=A0A1D3JJY6_PLAMA|nr:UDP-N-acetyl glucosamine:UMP antiporter, putative [Plasmodium malariae]KAI4839766.1 UDP-N-acetyl glucosamine:UMP antiporter [Plasmodium brasilianum]SBT86709.1 UDP-N-acetyl glucosamine:UMP antiporter, putative [Plasmodium malariae]